VTTLEITLIISNVLFFSLLVTSAYFNIKYGIFILKITEAVEDSLDILDTKYASISKILEIPLFFDSPQVRNVLKDIEESRDSILYVANLIGDVEEEE
tara:strand:- start:1170 stop:1463 length:294 start_codon:yes stop_codon:yes gene_type:complete